MLTDAPTATIQEGSFSHVDGWRKMSCKFTRMVSALFAASLVMAAMVGCADDKERVPADSSAIEAGLVVTPEFAISGVGELPDDVFIEDLFLGIGQIELEPLDGDRDIVYVSRDSVFLAFDVGSGQLSVVGEPMTLPHAGNFQISIPLQPVNVLSGEWTDLSGTSMQINGLVAEFAPITGGPGLVSSGEPTPLPLREGGAERPVRWVQWTYRSERSVMVRLDDVHFDDVAEQRLRITFDLSSWLDDAIAPITQTVIEQSVDGDADHDVERESDDAESRIDVSDDVDERGTGIEELTGSTEAVSL